MSKYDANRNLHEADRIAELETIIKLQEQKVLQQQQQLEQQQQQLEQAQQQNQQFQQAQPQHQLQQTYELQQEFRFRMTARDVMEQFRRLKPLDINHSPRAFINAVESNYELCGGDEVLVRFCTNIVRNEKILGNAGRRVRELQDNASWVEIKAKILQEFTPRRTYAEIFNYCRRVRVKNLDELFRIFEKCKYEINDIYLTDPTKPGIYKPENVDRDLVDILLEKIDGPIRAHIIENETLSDIIARYTKLKLLEDPRAIAYNHRINQFSQKSNKNFQKSKPNNLVDFSQQNRNFKNPRQGNYFNNFPNNYNNLNPEYTDKYCGTRQNYPPNNYNFSSSEHTNRNYRTRQNYQPTNYNNLSTQTKNTTQQSTSNNYPSGTKSNQTKTSYNSGQQHQTNYYRQEPEPMDIGNLKEEDVNFSVMPLLQNYP